MGFLDQVTGALSGAAGLSGQIGTMKAVGEWVERQGGMNGVVQKFQAVGLGEVVQSWIGTGKNLSVTPQQIETVLGATGLQDLAKTAGVTPADLAQKLSTLLPQVIDQLTPDGQLPSKLSMQDMIAQGTKVLGGTK